MGALSGSDGLRRHKEKKKNPSVGNFSLRNVLTCDMCTATSENTLYGQVDCGSLGLVHGRLEK